MGRPKIGAVSYLNTKPLVAGLENQQDFEVIFDLPSRLADRLSAQQFDVALIPVVEAVSNPEYVIVSDACIACRGPVWSVKLMSRVPAEEIKTLALDEGSRTSRALTRVFLEKKFDLTPTCHSLSIRDDWRETSSDAALIIGDRAMKAADENFPYVWDLGEAWNQWAGRPFVFAVWAAWADCDLDRLDRVLSESRDFGLKSIESISRAHHAEYALQEQECVQYLQEYLHFHLGVDEKAGMDRFFRHASELQLIPQSYQLQFHDCQTA